MRSSLSLRLEPGISFAVVGVVQDMRQWGPAYAALPKVYARRLRHVQEAPAAYGLRW